MAGSDPVAYQAGSDDEIVEFGAEGRRHSAWLARLLLAAAVVAALVVVLYHQPKHPSRNSAAPGQ